MMSITQAVLDNKADLGIIFVSQFAVAIPYQFAKHAMSIYANKHTSIDKPRQCTLGKASGTSDGAVSSKQRAETVVDPNLLGEEEAVEERGRRWRCADAGEHGPPGRPPLEVCGRWTLMGTGAASQERKHGC